jgi:hypothetical protein
VTITIVEEIALAGRIDDERIADHLRVPSGFGPIQSNFTIFACPGIPIG